VPTSAEAPKKTIKSREPRISATRVSKSRSVKSRILSQEVQEAISTAVREAITQAVTFPKSPEVIPSTSHQNTELHQNTEFLPETTEAHAVTVESAIDSILAGNRSQKIIPSTTTGGLCTRKKLTFLSLVAKNLLCQNQ
jgi:hypothetical protein